LILALLGWSSQIRKAPVLSQCGLNSRYITSAHGNFMMQDFELPLTQLVIAPYVKFLMSMKLCQVDPMAAIALNTLRLHPMAQFRDLNR
jgi:hypothetical protein